MAERAQLYSEGRYWGEDGQVFAVEKPKRTATWLIVAVCVAMALLLAFVSPSTTSAFRVVAAAPTSSVNGLIRKPTPSAQRARAVPHLRAQRNPQQVANVDESKPPTVLQKIGTGMTAFGLAMTMQAGAVLPSQASEFEVLAEPPPTENLLIDDGDIMSLSNKKELRLKLLELRRDTGYQLNVVTVRKLAVEPDVFTFADKVIEGWYPTAEEGDKQGVFVLVKATKDAAIVGGPSFTGKISDDLIDSILGENVDIFANEEKYNQAILSSVKRLEAAIRDKPDPGAPIRLDTTRKSNFKTSAQTEKNRGQYVTIVGSLLVIAFIVPMLQYFGYVSKD